MTDPHSNSASASEALGDRVRCRLDDIVRFARVVAHELGGTMLPSKMTAPDLETHPKWRRMQFQNQTLVDHLQETKAGIDRFRAGGDDGNPPTGFDDWAAVQRPLLSAVLRGGARLELVCESDSSSGCDAPWTRGVTMLLLAIDEQPPDGGAWEKVTVAFGLCDDGGRDAIRIELEPKPAGPLHLPEVCRGAWGNRRVAAWNEATFTLVLTRDGACSDDGSCGSPVSGPGRE